METIYLKLYNANDIYMSPSNEIMDEVTVLNHFPAVSHFPYIVQTDANGEIMYGFYSLSAMKSKYEIDSSLDNVEAVEAIETAMNKEIADQIAAELEAANAVTPEERIAAALEFQNLSNLPDVE